MSIIYVDECIDFSQAHIKTMGVEVVKSNYLVDGIPHFCDTENPLDYSTIYQNFKDGLKIESIPLSAKEYEEIFDVALSQGENIIYLHCSNSVSDGVKNAHLALDHLRIKYPKREITAFDTLGLSVQSGLICLEGAIQNKRGLIDKDILDSLNSFRDQTAFYFYANSFKNVYGNKINNLDTNYGSMSLIKPIFTVNDEGKIDCVNKSNGKNKAIADLVEYVKTYGENLADYPIAIVHTNCEKDAMLLKSKLVDLIGSDNKIWVECASVTTLSQIGQGALGVAFHAKKRV